MVITAFTVTVYAQSPQKMSYQCVVRNSAGALVANQAVGIKISILKGSSTGTVVFSETYSPNPQTNANGLVTVEIGGGTATVGTFAGIDWSAGPYFMKTETDPAGGTNYTISGTSQLLSVPYALYAKSAANGFSGSYIDLTNKPVLFDGTWNSLTGKPLLATVATSGSYNDLLNRPILFSGSYNDLTNKPILFDGTWSSLTGKPTTLSGYGITDADGSITNEIQLLSLSGTLLTLSNGGGTVTLPSTGGGDNWGTQTVVTNTTLTGAGTTANPLAVANAVITPSWSRIQDIPAGFADGTDNIDDADNSITNEIQTLNLSGTTLTLSSGGGSVTLPSSGGGDNWGTQTVVTDATLAGNGTTATPLRIADNGVSTVKIVNSAITADKLAANSVTSVKIAAAAVTGEKIAQAGATAGQSLKWNGTTWAPATDETGTGLTLPFSGTGTSSSPLFNITNLGTSGAISTLSSGNYGIWGESASTYGIGVYGVNKNSSGTTYGVFGDVYSPTGFSGFFQGGKFYIKGNTGIGTENPSAKLEVNGQVKITGGTPGAGKVLTSDGVGLATWQTPESNPWLKNSNNIYYNAGNVGIGLNNPTGMLEIYGNSVDSYPQLSLSEADGFARVSFRTMLASAKHWVLAGHTNQTDGESQWHLNYFNGSVGKNIFSVYGNSSVAFDGNVGIGTATPSSKLEVAGQVKITGGAPGAGKVLTSDASGLASWQAPSWLKNGNHIYYNTGNVAIGMTFPRYELTIYQDNDPHIGFYNSTSGTSGTDGFTISTSATGSPVWIWNWENSNMHFATNNTNRMIINADGHVSMMRSLDLNTESTFGALYVKGKQALWWDGTYFSWGYDAEYNYFADKVTIGNPSNPSYMLYVQGNAYATGSWSSSDARFKKDILPISNSLERIMKIRGTSFEFRNDEFKDYQFADGIQYGFIAQELESIFPEVVKTESNGYKSVNYNGIIPVLVEAIKEQQKIINDLKYENEHLKTNNDQVENIIKQLKADNEAINTRLENIEALYGYSAKR